MGCWGMGMAQTDEYCEIYERFMEEYDEGKPLPAITGEILEDMLAEFDAGDPIMHDVYFALAKAQWMCGGVDSALLTRVTEIIESGDNLTFYEELGATPADLKLRKRNLAKFLTGLQTPRPTVRKRKKPETKYVPAKRPTPLPKCQPGDVIAYRAGEQWRVLLVCGIHRSRLEIYATCFLWKDFFGELPCRELLERSRGILFSKVTGDVFPRDFQVLGNWSVSAVYWMAHFYARPWYQYLTNPAEPGHLYGDLPTNLAFPYRIAYQQGLDWLERHSPNPTGTRNKP